MGQCCAVSTGPRLSSGVPGDVEKSSQRFRPYWHRHLLAQIVGINAAGQAVCCAQGQAADPVVADVLLDFEDQPFTVVVHLYGVEEVGQLVGRNSMSTTVPITCTILPVAMSFS